MTPLAVAPVPVMGGGLMLRGYDPGLDDGPWDELVSRSVNGTFLHTRRFLSYHGDRFTDRSLLVADADGRLRGVLPAAAHPEDPGVVVSHPGISFGGLVHDGTVRSPETTELLAAAAASYAAVGARAFRYKPVPAIYHRGPAADDLYALARLGAVRYRCDLSATIDLDRRLPLGASRRKPARAARNRGVVARWGWEPVAEFWEMLEAGLEGRHGVRPTHTLDEIRLLARRFPDAIRLVVAALDGQVVAGAVMFLSFPVAHLQYIAATDAGRRVGATDTVVEAGVAAAAADGYRYYDFGISTEDEGRVLNTGLQSFKLSFGAGSVVFEHYEVTLR